MALPDGVVTFLFTDVEGSTHTWEEAPDSMMDALRRHDEVIEGAAVANDGIVVRPRGEGLQPMPWPRLQRCSVRCMRLSGRLPSRCGCGLHCIPASPSRSSGTTTARR